MSDFTRTIKKERIRDKDLRWLEIDEKDVRIVYKPLRGGDEHFVKYISDELDANPDLAIFDEAPDSMALVTELVLVFN